MFDRFLCLTAGGTLLLASTGQAATLSYEGFDVPGDYADNADINGGSGGENFSGAWAGSDQFDAAATGLSYGSLVTTDGAADRQSPSGFATLTRDFAASNQTGNVYFSYLIQNPNDTNENDRVSLADASGSERFRIGFTNDEKLNLQVQLAGGDGSNYIVDTSANSFDFTSPVLVVGEIEINSGVNDTFTVWVNPSDLSDVAGSAAETLSASVTDVRTLQVGNNNGLFAGINEIAIRNTARTYTFDEIRISTGTDAAVGDVVPVPEPGSLGLVALGVLAMLGRGRRA
jgi:hypothetical protein